jgi:hypothetical protein
MVVMWSSKFLSETFFFPPEKPQMSAAWEVRGVVYCGGRQVDLSFKCPRYEEIQLVLMWYGTTVYDMV